MAGVTIDPRRYRAVVFDLDGVVTDTASVHAAAWTRLFDEYLRRRPAHPGEDHTPFTQGDYRRYVDGKPRYDGVAAFLSARGVSLQWGEPSDGPDRETVCGLGNRKDGYFRERLAADGVRVFESTVELVRRLRANGVRVAVISASRNCADVLARAGLGDLFEARVDGVLADELGLPGKPDPAVFLEAARRVGVPPGHAVVVEDAQAGVTAGHRGGFGLVIGIARTGHPGELAEHGADVVVSDLAEVGLGEDETRPLSAVPDALADWDAVAARLRDRDPVLLLDFDGTLAPIVADPARAELPAPTRQVLDRLARLCPVAVISGRDLADVRHRVGIPGIRYAGSHGFQLLDRDGTPRDYAPARGALAALAQAETELWQRLSEVQGVLIEPKRFVLAVHYRNVADADVRAVIEIVRQVGARHDGLRVAEGRKVIELRPDVDWDKGRAVDWVLTRTGLADRSGALPVYAGDDLTDEDALRAVRHNGIGIVVRNPESGDRRTAAHFAVADPDRFREVLERIARLLEERAHR